MRQTLFSPGLVNGASFYRGNNRAEAELFRRKLPHIKNPPISSKTFNVRVVLFQGIHHSAKIGTEENHVSRHVKFLVTKSSAKGIQCIGGRPLPLHMLSCVGRVLWMGPTFPGSFLLAHTFRSGSMAEFLPVGRAMGSREGRVRKGRWHARRSGPYQDGMPHRQGTGRRRYLGLHIVVQAPRGLLHTPRRGKKLLGAQALLGCFTTLDRVDARYNVHASNKTR